MSTDTRGADPALRQTPAGISLRTARLVIRTVAPHDAAALLAYVRRNRAHLERWAPERPPDFETLPYWERFVADTELEREAGKRLRFIASTERRPDDIIARVNLHHIEYGAVSTAMLGYSVDVRHEGSGFAREAVLAVVGHAFDVLQLHRIEAKYQPLNERSGRLLRWLGFVIEGYARDYMFVDGGWRDHILTSLTRPENRPTSNAGPDT